MTDYYVDSVSGDDANNGTSTATPKQTFTQVNALTGARGGDTVNLKRGSTFREALIMSDVNGTSTTVPFVIQGYGTGDKPLILGSELASGFVVHSGSIYSKSYVAEQEVTYNNARVKKVTALGSMTANSAFYDSGVLYVWMPGGINPNSKAEITILDRCVNIQTTDGFVEIRDLDCRNSRIHGMRLAAEAAATPASCKIIGNHSQFHGIDASSPTASDCILFDGTSTAARGSAYEIAHNTGGDCFNNFIELSYMDSCHIHNNRAERMGGCGVELFRACSTNLIQRNWFKDMTDADNIAQYHESFVWIASTGSDVSTDNDIFYNIATNARVRGVHSQQGTTNVIGNVITGCPNRAIDFGNEVAGNFAMGEIKNNIFGILRSDADFTTPKFINYEVDDHTDMDIDNNTYWEQDSGPNIAAKWSTNSGAASPSVNTAVFADWIKATGAGGSGQDANSTFVTDAPLFTDFDNDDLTLLSTANEINAGVVPTTATTATTDYNGDSVGASPDIGAYKNQFGVVSSGISPTGMKG